MEEKNFSPAPSYLSQPYELRWYTTVVHQIFVTKEKWYKRFCIPVLMKSFSTDERDIYASFAVYAPQRTQMNHSLALFTKQISL